MLLGVCATALFGGAALAQDTALGRDLYGQHRAACPGADLTRAADWRQRGPDGRFPPPPHDETGHTWHHSDAMLFDYTRQGGQAFLDDLGVRFDSGMPAFGDILSDAEIEAIFAFIQSTWPEEMRAFQAERTAAESATSVAATLQLAGVGSSLVAGNRRHNHRIGAGNPAQIQSSRG